jgi:hypothetical protein
MGRLGIFFFVAVRSMSYGRRSIFRAMLKIGSAAFAMSWIGLSIYHTFSGYSSYRQLQEMRSAGVEQLTQGIVVEFLRMKVSRWIIECFHILRMTFGLDSARPAREGAPSKMV